MQIREATINDIPRLQLIRNAVKENVLSNPALVKDEDYSIYLNDKGRGWVSVVDDVISGFAIVDLVGHNVWALFVHPDHEGRGAGKLLHDEMMHWYFGQTDYAIWLSTAPGTRAAKFYRTAGWTETGIYGKGELKFEMTKAQWTTIAGTAE